MEKISTTAKQIKLMTHVVIGYPSLKETEAIVLAMAKAGVDYIELQMPFSDPLADGPVIMQANQVAIKNKIGMQDNLSLMKKLSQKVTIPLLFMGYYNTIFKYGVSKFCREAKQAGAYGLIIPDMPLEEEKYEKFYAACKKNNLVNIFVVSPATTDDRLKKINKYAKGFIYCMARYGITGTNNSLDKKLNSYLKRVKKYIKLPLGVGFGISKPEHIKALKNKANIAIIGSAIIKIINKSDRQNRLKNIKNFIKSLCV